MASVKGYASQPLSRRRSDLKLYRETSEGMPRTPSPGFTVNQGTSQTLALGAGGWRLRARAPSPACLLLLGLLPAQGQGRGRGQGQGQGVGRAEDLLFFFSGAHGMFLSSAYLSSLCFLLLSIPSFPPPAPHCPSAPPPLLAVGCRAVLPSETPCVTCTGAAWLLPGILTVGLKLGSLLRPSPGRSFLPRTLRTSQLGDGSRCL